MGFRFHKSRKILPGVRLNVSKGGPGLSLGVRGMRRSWGPSGSRTTLSIPGTGLSYIKHRRSGAGSQYTRGTATTGRGKGQWSVLSAVLVALLWWPWLTTLIFAVLLCLVFLK